MTLAIASAIYAICFGSQECFTHVRALDPKTPDEVVAAYCQQYPEEPRCAVQTN